LTKKEEKTTLLEITERLARMETDINWIKGELTTIRMWVFRLAILMVTSLIAIIYVLVVG